MKKIFFFSLMTIAFSCVAQTETDIRNHYNTINRQIIESIEHGYEGPLYQNQWVTNKNSRSWPAVGIYQDTTNFWYDDPPDHLDASERDPKNVLLKITTVRHASHLHSNEEYLFKDSRLLFYYLHDAEEGNEWETRVWFNNKGVMIKSSVKVNGVELKNADFLKEDHKDLKPNPLNIQKEAKKYQDLFVKSMM